MKSFKAAYYQPEDHDTSQTVLTGPEHRGLDEIGLKAVALCQAEKSGLLDVVGIQDFLERLIVGTWIEKEA